MIVLPQDQIDHMKEIMDFLLKNPTGFSVYEIKRMFNLNSDEYEMIYDLCMPLIREKTVKQYWATKYKHFIEELKKLIKQRKYITDIQFYKELRKIVYAESNGEPLMLEAAGMENEKEEAS